MLFLETLKEHVIVIDGATGTMIQDLDLSDADFGGPDYKMLSDLLTFSRPEDMKKIHYAYYEAGAYAVETNTFGASTMRLAEYDFSKIDTACFAPLPYGLDIHSATHETLAYVFSRRGAELACEARDEYKKNESYDGRPLFVLGSIGPSNRVLTHTQADLVESTFDEIKDNFRQQVSGLVDGGADVLLFETQQDILELKAGVFGALEAMAEKDVRLPIMAQVTVDRFSRMQIFNTDIHAALVALEGIGVDVFGVNCSIGPDLMERTVEKMTRVSNIPISVIPNAGLPVSEGGRTVFKFPPERFAEYQKKFVEEYGVNVVGGCCGTTPEHIRLVANAVRGIRPKKREAVQAAYVSGPQEAVLLDGSETLIRFGERLNVRGSKKVRLAVENETGIDHDVLEEVVEEQVRGLGCEIIDVCMDSNQIDTVSTLCSVVHRQNANFPAAMCLDSFQVDALAEAIKVYPGRPIINSISMEEASPGVLKIDAVIQATQGHAPFYVALCTGPKGPAATAEEKLDLSTQIVEHAAKHYNVPCDRLFIDVNVFPIGSESEESMNFALESLEGIRRVKEAFPTCKTTLGVGNLTNGLAKKPYMRKVLTSVFLDEARKRGLDAAIINPNHYVFIEDLEAKDAELGRRAVMERDMDAYAELEIIAEEKKGIVVERRTSYDDLALEEAIVEKIKDGFKERKQDSFEYRGHRYDYKDCIVPQVAQAMDTHQPLDFINDYLMRAMQDLGDGFGRGEVSLPHLLKSADVMREAMSFLESFMHNESGVDLEGEIQYKGAVVLGTVYQDVHSIGKDLARTLLENYGYRVIDLGTMTPLQEFIDKAKEHKADAIGMSALLVQTSNHMITVARMMEEQGLNLPILVGGAPVSYRHAAYVAMRGQDDPEKMHANVFYCRTAMDGVNVMNKLQSKEDLQPYFDANLDKLQKRLVRAEQRAQKDADLLKTLPGRIVPFDGRHRLPEMPRFRQQRHEFPLKEFARYIDKRNLFSLNWRFGGQSSATRTGYTQEKLELLFEEWIEKAAKKNWLQPQGVVGIFPCQSEGNEIILYDPETQQEEIARLSFTTVVGAGKRDTVCAAQFFHPVSSGIMGAVGLQISTCGPQVDRILVELKEDGDSESNLFLQGLSDRIAEDLAQFLHMEQRRLLNLADDDGQRWSPGYPGMRDMENNATIVRLLDATKHVGVRLTEANEFSPTGTTAAVLSYHPEARYE